MEDIKKSSDEKKNYLNSYKQTVIAAKLIEEEIQEIESHKVNPSYSLERISGGNKKSDLSDYVVLIERKTEELYQARYRRIKTYSDILSKIEEMEDETEKNLLRLKYIHNKTWEEVGEMIGYSYRQVHNIHNKALANFKM
jgi:DNA-directed RNA polymerase sigma subunit (sigma70/sigma32)